MPTKQEETRYPYPHFNPFRKFVMDELIRRKTTYPPPLSSPFVKLTSCKVDPVEKYAFFTLGLHGFDALSDLDIFDATYNRNRDIVGWAYSLRDAPVNGLRKKVLVSADQVSRDVLPPSVKEAISPSTSRAIEKQQDEFEQRQKTILNAEHPIPGITSVSVNRRGIGTPLIANITWTCYNRSQLEFLRNHFLVVGGYVVLEWGHLMTDGGATKMLNFANDNEVRHDITEAIMKGRNHIIQKWVTPNDGNYDFMVGYVGNFRVNLEAETQVYTCTTTIYSVGEQMWGLNSFMTFVNKAADVDSNEINRGTTIHDFFKNESFDRLVGEYSNLREYVAGDIADWGKKRRNVIEVPEDYGAFSTNANDYLFVSWNFFNQVMIPRMFALIQDETAAKELKTFIELFVNKAMDGQEDPEFHDWVGNAPALKSTDPDVMVIYKDGMDDPDQAFSQAGGFGSEPEGYGYRGKLNRGVWLNTGMIKRCFLETNTFQSALQSILMHMNSATAGFWKLQLFFDEEVNRYKIIDAGFTLRPNQGFYKFNSSLNFPPNESPNGELLGLELDSAFPAELVTQMALFSKFKSESLPTQEDLLRRYPSIGTTSTFMFSLNWTKLDDIIAHDLRNIKEGTPLEELGKFSQPNFVLSPTEGNERTMSRMMPHSAATVATSKGQAQPNRRLGFVESLVQGANLNDTEVNVCRESALPIAPAKPIENDPLAQYRSEIDSAAQKHNVEPELIEAVIIAESGGRATARPYDDDMNSAMGLMQMTPSTARHLGYNGTPEGLFDPARNIDLGTQHLADILRRNGDDYESAISEYNAGYRPHLGYGAPRQGAGTVRVCNFWKEKPVKEVDPVTGKTVVVKPGVCHDGQWVEVAPGQYGNQPYVNKVMQEMNRRRAARGKEMYQGRATDPAAAYTPLNPTTTMDPWTFSQSGGPTDDPEKATAITKRFGSKFWNFIEGSPSGMINRITRSGFDRYPAPNGFVCPFPTTTAVTLTILGISGISVSDGFFVDKLPYIFEKFGCFQVTQVDEEITEQGWVTKVQGYFKLLWMGGEGPLPAPIG